MTRRRCTSTSGCRSATCSCPGLSRKDRRSIHGTNQYGAGTVVVWDTGTYHNITERHGEPVPMPGAVDGGHLVVWLDGHKLHGAFVLTRSKVRGKDEWLLIKKDDDDADRRRKPATTRPESVLTGRTNEELASR